MSIPTFLPPGAGTPVTLTWIVAYDSYGYFDMVGMVLRISQTVSPTAATTYTLKPTNQYGRETITVTRFVH